MPAPMPDAGTAGQTTLDDIVGSAFRDTMVEGGAEESSLQRDASGRFVPREADEIAEQDAARPGKPKGEPAKLPEQKAEPAKVEAKPGESVVLEAADPAELVTKFTLKDGAGELAIPKGLTIEFQANGKVRTEPLDRVVQFAQMGYYNHDREQRFLQVEAQSQEVEQYAGQLEQTVREREQQMEQLLRDPDFRDRAIAAYQQEQTPEQKAIRLQRELDESRNGAERMRLATAGDAYFTTQIVPSVEKLIEALPHVTAQEITDRLKPFVDRQKGPLGLVPPDRYDAISQYVLSEIVPWAKQVDQHRALERGTRSGAQRVSDQTAAQHQKDAEVAAANVRTQRLRRQATANLKPPGRGAAQSAKPKGPVTHQSAMEDVIASTKAAMGMA